MDGAHHWAYDLLKRLACEKPCSTQDLEELKQTFAAEIGSVRKLDRIQTIHDLIEVLERHDYLSLYNIDPIREMAEQCGESAIQHAVSAYNTPKETTGVLPFNSYRADRLAEEVRENLHINTNQRTMVPPAAPAPSAMSLTTSSGSLYVEPPSVLFPGIQQQQQHQRQTGPNRPHLVTPAENMYQQQINHSTAQQQRTNNRPGPIGFNEDKRSAVYKNLSSKLGTDWRNFGRELRITEGEMDQIEAQFPRDIVSRIYRMLHLFEEDKRNNPQSLIFTLCRALDNCRRKDLRRDIEDILAY